MNKLDKEFKVFYIQFPENYFNKKDILASSNGTHLKILETPHKKWWKQLLQFVTFGLYKALYQYKVKLL